MYDKVALKDNWVISAADGSDASLVLTRIPILSPTETTKGPKFKLVAA